MAIASLPALLPLALVPTTQAPEAPAPEPRGLVARAEGACEGYTLFSPLNSKRVYLIGMNGEVAHEWRTEHTPTGAVYLLENGNLLRCAREEENPRFEGGGIGGRVEEIDWEGRVVWEYVLADDYQTQHHDIHPMPDGDVLLVAWEHRYREDAIAYGRDPEKIADKGMWPDALLEVRPTRPQGGEVVWEWHAWDHLAQDLDPERENHCDLSDRPELLDINFDVRNAPPLTPEEQEKRRALEEEMRALGYTGGGEEEAEPATPQPGNLPDWLHTNGIDYQPAQDLIVFSVPNLSELFVIDHSTTTDQAAGHTGGRRGKGGDILYRWGNPQNYGCGSDADRRLYFQHHPQWIPGDRPGELRLLVFNNGQGRPDKEFSSVDELLLPFDPQRGFLREKGRGFGPEAPAWSYSDPERFYSSFISGAQRLSNGNTLICSGAQGRVFEVTRDGRVVWDYENPHGGDVAPPGNAGSAPRTALFRATRIPKDHPGLAGRNLP